MNRIRSFGTWLMTGVVTLVAGAGLVLADQSPRLASLPTTNVSHRPTSVTTSPPLTSKTATPHISNQISIHEAADPVIRIDVTTTTPPTTSSTSTTSTTTSTTTTTLSPTTTTTIHRHGGGDDGGGDGGGSDDGGDD